MHIEEQPYDERHYTPPAQKRTPLKVPNMGELTTREYDIVLNPDEHLDLVMADFIAAAETEATGFHPLMWRQLKSQGQWPRVQVQGELGRVLKFEEELNSQSAQKKLQELRNGWIRRHTDSGFEWLRVIWLPAEEPAPAHCDMPGCDDGFRQRWAIAYKVACKGGHVPVDGDIWTYCQRTVMSDNDIATFIKEDK